MAGRAVTDRPNIILTVVDNAGYGDLGCYGCGYHRTPHLDRMAAEGLRFTSFYSTSGVCTPSRASIMTGCYPRRVNMHAGGRGHAVLMPVDPKGLHPGEITVARLLKGQGYATACIGKWHLGDQAPFLPTRHGFDLFFGCPYSEDMVPSAQNPDRPPLPLMRGESVVEAPADRNSLTARYTEEAIRFVKEHRERPFFLYLAHAMPGSTAHPFPGAAFQGRSSNGPYGDAIEELDWSCGELAGVLEGLGIAGRTLQIWLSDNGAVHWEPPQGSNCPLEGWGYDTSEGAQRVPCLARWPGRISPGRVTDRVTTTMDFLPTAARLAGGAPPGDRTIDGHDLGAVLSGQAGDDSPYDENGFFYYHMQQLQAVRSGPWKLYLPLKHKIRNLRGKVEGSDGCYLRLYDVRRDLGENGEVSARHPEVVKRLTTLAEHARRDLGDWDREGADQRPAGWVQEPRPQVLP
jgi:arylsulfatase A